MFDAKKKTPKAVVILWKYDDETWSWECLMPPLVGMGSNTALSPKTYDTKRNARRSAFRWCKRYGYMPISTVVFPGCERDNA